MVMLLASPGAIFFSFIYTESLFLLLLTLCLRCLEARRDVGTAIFAFLLPLTRAVGIFVVFPILISLWQKRPLNARFWVVLAPFCGYLTYFVVMWHACGDPFGGFAAQEAYVNTPSIKNILDLKTLVVSFFHVEAICSPRFGLLDRIYFYLLLLTLPLVWRQARTHCMLVIFMGIVPALSNVLLSYTRFIVICFPIFAVLADSLVLQRRWRQIAIFVGLSLLLQLYCLRRFLNFWWVG
jgi:hypothetical protein